MMYLAWAAYYEGHTDAAYFNAIIPRMIDEILRSDGVRPYEVGLAPAVQFGVDDRSFESVSRRICERSSEFHILIVHADFGGRAQGETIADRRENLVCMANRLCEFDVRRAVYLSPRRELEAWALIDQDAILRSLGLSCWPDNLDRIDPKGTESLPDPKSTLAGLVQAAFRRRRADNVGVLVRIAQEQRVDRLRISESFREFELSLRDALVHSGCIER